MGIVKQYLVHLILSSMRTRHIHAWMRGNEYNFAEKSNRHSVIHEIIYQTTKKQEEIGLDRAVREQLSKKWRRRKQ